MIIEKDENTGQVKFICEFSHAEFVDIKEFRKHTESLFKEKNAYLIELIQNQCAALDHPLYSNYTYFSYEVHYTMAELTKLKHEYNQCSRFIEDNDL